ncbi:MAG: deoxyhypusine synthase family protein [archaeon]
MKVRQIRLEKGMTVNQLVEKMGQSRVMGAGRIARATDVMQQMIEDRDCTVFLGIAGALVPGGMKNVIIDLLGHADVVVTTGATLTHDLVEALGYSHYRGCAQADDAVLNKKRYDRIYDVYMPDRVYEGLEEFFKKHFDALKDAEDIREFLFRLGSLVKAKDSILRTCHDRKIPLYCPAIADSGIGLMIWGHLAQGKRIRVGAFDDLKSMLDTAWTSKKAGVIYLGGGVPKNYIQQAMQLSPRAASYGVQITMDRPEPGGSSGAELREGISWGKMNKDANFVDVICDVTIALPIIVSALKERLK